MSKDINLLGIMERDANDYQYFKGNLLGANNELITEGFSKVLFYIYKTVMTKAGTNIWNKTTGINVNLLSANADEMRKFYAAQLSILLRDIKAAQDEAGITNPAELVKDIRLRELTKTKDTVKINIRVSNMIGQYSDIINNAGNLKV